MYPSVITSFSYPTTTDRLNNPSHSALHNTTSSAVGQVQAFIGTLPASAIGTLLYDIRSPDSNGGGHVQAANKGGTGQTTYNKGDILVASSSSVLTKLSAGVENQILQVNSSTATGLQWGSAPARPKIAVSGSVMTFVGNINVAQSVMSVTIPGSTLGTNNAVKARLFTEMILSAGTPGFDWTVHYGTSLIGTQSIPVPAGNTTASIRGTLEVNLIAANSNSSQLGSAINSWQQLGSSMLGTAPTFRNINVDSTRDRVLDVAVIISNNVGNTSVVTRGYTVEKLD